MAFTRIPLHSKKNPGLFAVVDPEDLPLIEGYRWNPVRDRGTGYFYARGRKNGGPDVVSMHRIILGVADPSLQVDHIRHGCAFGTLFNSRSNIHLVTCSQNGMNSISRAGSSKFKGVHWFKPSGKWRAQIKFQREYIYLGLFVSEVDAAKAYDLKARELGWPEYALNLPGG